MQLKFLAKPEHLQPWPASHHYGQPRRYIGWQWVPEMTTVAGAAPSSSIAPGPKKDAPAPVLRGAGYVAKQDGDVVDEAVIPSAIVEEIKRACLQGALIAGNEETARACGVDFVEHNFSETGFTPKPEVVVEAPAPAVSPEPAAPAPSAPVEPETAKASPAAKTKADKSATKE